MTYFDLNMRKSLLLELRQQLDIERRKNTLLKTKMEQKRTEDFFTAQAQMKLRPIGPTQNNKSYLTKETILTLSKQLRHFHMPNSIALKGHPRPHPEHDDHDKQLQALKKFKQRFHAKKRHVEQHIAQHEQAKQELEKQHRRSLLSL
ncbi:MAG: hypothetical protein CK424_08325 [Legionella sp.]|nr:MAG: hypothetical protein CK424_08325 [Legionella sp.]